MIDDVNDIKAMYDRDPDKEHQRLERHQLEYELTWRYLDRYLPVKGSILEIGAASGRYTIELAKRGYRVTAVDMSGILHELCRERITDAGVAEQVRLVLADARYLSPVESEDFDTVLLMGPLYHLVEEADRITALREAHRCLKDGGESDSQHLSAALAFGET